MNITIIDNLFDKLKQYEKVIKYQFEPQTPNKTLKGQRSVYFSELKKDFIDEIKAYGFSPYIHQTSDEQQWKLKSIKHKKQSFNYGLTNYILKKTHNQKPILFAKKHLDIIPKSSSVKDFNHISSASNLIKAFKRRTTLGCLSKGSSALVSPVKHIGDVDKNDGNQVSQCCSIGNSNSNSESMKTLSRLFDKDYNPMKDNEGYLEKKHKQLRLKNELKENKKKLFNNALKKSIGMSMNKSIRETNVNKGKHNKEKKKSNIKEKICLFKTPIVIKKSSSYQELIGNITTTNNKKYKVKTKAKAKFVILSKDLFKSKKEAIDSKQLIVENNPGSIFHRLQRISNSHL